MGYTKSLIALFTTKLQFYFNSYYLSGLSNSKVSLLALISKSIQKFSFQVLHHETLCEAVIRLSSSGAFPFRLSSPATRALFAHDRVPLIPLTPPSSGGGRLPQDQELRLSTLSVVFYCFPLTPPEFDVFRQC